MDKTVESQSGLNEERHELAGKLTKQMPDFMATEFEVIGSAFRDGALSGKVKCLMALVLALGSGITNCILAQTEFALEAGATKEEILEAIQVVISMRGTSGMAESLRVIKLLEELGKI